MLNWKNKQDGVDDVLAEDINNIANELIASQISIDQLKFSKQDKLTAGDGITIDENNVISATGGGGSGGTTDYALLENKPQINGVELVGNKSLTDLGIDIPTKTSELENDSGFIDDAALENYYTKTEVDEKTVVDQTYTPDSENPQSGKAVAEAINEIDDKKVNKILRSDVADISEYDHTPDRVPYIYGVYGNEVYEEQQGLIKGSMGKLRKEMAAQIEKDDEKGAKSILSGVIPSKYRGMLDLYTVAIRDGNCSIPVGYHAYDEDKNGNIINSKLYYGAAVPYSYVNAIADKKAVTSISVIENQTYEFDWNAMYFMKSNTNNKDIEILDGNGNRVTDYKYSYCLLILPKESFERTQWTVSTGKDRKKDTIHGLVAGMSDKYALIDTAKIEMLQFDVDPTKKLTIKPQNAQIYKIAF